MNKAFFYFMIMLISCNDRQPDRIEQISALPAKEQQLKDAVKQFPDSLLLKENLIQYYRENGNLDNAMLEINNAIKKDSNNARLWDIKAILHFEDGDTSNAIRSFEKAVERFPEPAYIISLGSLYAQTKNPAALQLADALLIGNKAHAEKEALFIKGLYYAAINEKQKAISFFDQCISLNHTFMDAYREKAIALYDMGKYNDALAVLDKATTLQNSFEEGYYYEGKCLEKLNRLPEAIASYQTALMYAPDYIEAKEALARLGIKS